MSCHVMSCHVMSYHVISCHVAIIVSKFLKKLFSKTFLFFKIIYKYFAGFLACINGIIHCHYEGNARSNLQKRDFIILDCFANARNDGTCHNDKNFQFDKFQRFLSVIYKKFITKGDLNYVKSQNNF